MGWGGEALPLPQGSLGRMRAYTGPMSLRPAVLALSLAPLAIAGGFSESPRPTDPMAALQRKLASGAKLPFHPTRGYLDAVLRELGISPASQTLVFSKTSLQSSFIHAKNPRALYFNREAYVGWIPGAPLLEIMSVDPAQGIQFWTIPNEPKVAARAKREDDECFRCHGGRGGFPAATLFVQSSHTAPSGYPRVSTRAVLVTPRTPFSQRWGGWYVTGKHGKLRHLGNEFAEGTDEKHRIDVERGANRTSLAGKFNVSKYPAPGSDIAALLVAEHQMHVQNVLTRAGHLLRAGSLDLDDLAQDIADAFLCVGEAPLEDRIIGDPAFARAYLAESPKDPRGRSLAELRLMGRLFRWSFSPMVYSASFASLPASIHAKVRARVEAALASNAPRYKHLTDEDRRVLPEILAGTGAPGWETDGGKGGSGDRT